MRAQRGERAAYAPIVSPLAGTSDPVDIARGYLAVYPFRRVYVADLDGIEGRGRDDASLERLRAAVPDVELWVDNGLADEESCRAWLARDLGRLVLGSESQRDPGLAEGLGAVLSLDFRAEENAGARSREVFLGPPRLLEDADLWPAEVVVMTLARVGSGLGPDTERVAGIRARARRSRIFAAGGVRHAADVGALEAAGAAGALVASALHDGRIGRRELVALTRRIPPGAGPETASA